MWFKTHSEIDFRKYFFFLLFYCQFIKWKYVHIFDEMEDKSEKATNHFINRSTDRDETTLTE